MNNNRVIVVSVVAALITLTVILGAVLLTNAESFSPDVNTTFTQSGTAREITISGAITPSGSNSLFSQTRGSQEIADRIEEAGENDAVDAVLLEINSPGGAPVASHEIVRAVERVDKPVAAQIREVGASGAYWVASAADHIVADPVSITGSVGVTASYLEYSGLLDRFNVSYEQITVGKYKELGSPYKNLSEEKRRVLQSKINLTGEYFFDDVAEKRGLTERQRDRVKTGVWFVGQEATDAGLVDDLGSEQAAMDYLERATNKSLSLEQVETETSLLQRLSQAKLSQSMKDRVRGVLASQATPSRPMLE